MESDGFRMATLSEFVEAVGERRAEAVLRRYRAAHESATEAFLRERAVEMEKRDLSRTYLFLTRDMESVLGYVTLGIKCLRMPDGDILSDKVRRAMNIDARTDIAQSYLLGQLSRSVDAPKGTGAALLDLAFEHLDAARREVGCRIVRLDCRDELILYYAEHGFKPVSKNVDGDLNQMVAFIRGPRASGRSERVKGCNVRRPRPVKPFGGAAAA